MSLLTALVVEDDPFIRMNVEVLFEDEGYHVVAAGDAHEALRLLDRGLTPDLLVTDVDMPGTLDGVDLAQNARDRWPELRILIVSGRGQVSAERMPPDAVFVAKPFNDRHLISAARAA